MDRLPLVALFLAACVGSEPVEPPPSRVNAVPAPPKRAADLDAFCEVRKDGAEAPMFQFPALESPPPEHTPGWTWVNVWATWCGPCVEEMPRLLEWEKKLASEGAPVRLQFVSNDAGSQELELFRKKHAWAPPTVRMTDPGELTRWLSPFGVQNPVLPVHLFVDGENRVRCARTAAISESEYDSVKALVRQ